MAVIGKHCVSCGTRGDWTNEYSQCSRLSRICGRPVRHEWEDDEKHFTPYDKGIEPATVEERKPILPEDSTARKELPIYSGVRRYFPRSLAYLAKISKFGNDKHNGAGSPLRWTREKSNDHLDCVDRHLTDAGTKDKHGLRHSGYLVWRGLANLEEELEAADWPESENKNANS